MHLLQLARNFSAANLRYHFTAAMTRFRGPPICPACGNEGGELIDRKGFHTLHECGECHLLFRHPRETAVENAEFYQDGYAEPGLTTELPDPSRLDDLLRDNFRGSEKDFTYHISILQALGARPGTRVLDYGANWGYASYQFRKAGFDVEAYEVSVARAEYGTKLGISILTDASKISREFDIVYSCHVLEHVASPSEILREQMSYLRPGGLVVAHTPNGSSGFRRAEPKRFRKIWGRVHPVLLTNDYVPRLFPSAPLYVSSVDAPEIVARWDRRERRVDACDGGGLFFAARSA